jgi:LVIVD repeat
MFHAQQPGRSYFRAAALTMVTFLAAAGVFAQAPRTHASLPTLAQEPGIAFQLYSERSDGSVYLYIEQNQGARLLVLDVTNPAHIKMVREVTLTAQGPFEFVRALGSSSLLINYHNKLGMAVLDLRKPKAPVIRAVPGLQHPGYSESLGDSTLLIVDQPRMDSPAIPRDYQVVDTSNPADPFLLFTVKQVNATLSRNETGTTFLLGHDGLTIIRRPQVEDQFQTEQRYTN